MKTKKMIAFVVMLVTSSLSLLLVAQPSWEYSQTGAVSKATSKKDMTTGTVTLKSGIISETEYNTTEVHYTMYLTDAAVGIGQDPGPDNPYMLSVTGCIGANRVEVVPNIWADDVFEDKYVLMPLKELKEFIEKEKHLPGVPVEEEIKDSKLDLGEMNATLLRKVEELTLYILEQEKRIKALEENLANSEQ